MSRVEAESVSSANGNSSLFYPHSVEIIAGELSASSTGDLTLGQLFKHATADGTSVGETNIDVTKLLPVPLVLSFNNLTYSVRVRRKLPLLGFSAAGGGGLTKKLLNDISGEARDGEILAVLGASGSGKSTLIDALANRIAKGSLQGNITINDDIFSSRMLKAISAYVMQHDLLFPMLTVEESLMFAAEFRLPRTLSKSNKKTRVQALIEQLGLRNAAKTVIGDQGHQGVSGGERRRVSIGIDIIHDPIVLFLDEPTSGLDSTSAFMIVKALQRIAQSGSIVIMSVHQPSYRILGSVDRLIILSRGRTVYSGLTTNMSLYLSDFGHPIPENENKIEFALDLIWELEESLEGTKSLVEFNKSWQRRNSEPDRQISSLKEAISISISRGKLVSGVTIDAGSTSMVPTFANSVWKEITVLSIRSIRNSRRMPEVFGIRLAAVLLTGLILSSIFWQLDNSPKGVQKRLGYFVFAMSTTFYTCTDAFAGFLLERYIFVRETAYNSYRRLSYVISNALVALPGLIVLAFAFSTTTFWTIGLKGGFFGFLFYFLIIFASFWSGSSLVTFISGVIPHLRLGYPIIVAILAIFLLFSGFFINRDQIPTYWIWFHYVSLIKYPYEAVLRNELDNRTECFVRGIQIFDGTPLEAVSDAMKVRLLQSLSDTLGTSEITSSTCLTTGVDVLMKQGISDLSKWDCFLITLAWGLFFRVLFYFSLLFGSKNKRT
ncbi:ABC transporter G family member 16 [Hibiscus syriacus]|uniref:ABC transporter G family member 16 n=1 Tax=Hibiscus syriacus TaxID=106335 RepID=A0A6A2XS98_HIBSY|nr:ABC transporter G family member 6-like [Hibiscus syriacus]KAE8679461.1 ABC transporter G family member 16 [Hibiscus syriacus]